MPPRWLSPAELAPARDLAVLRALLEDHDAADQDQHDVRRRMLAFLAEHGSDAHERTCLEGHFTGSALLVDATHTRALLTWHRKLGRWLQLGGHADGDANLVNVALREAQEESGIEDVEIAPAPIDLDIHTIPARPGEPEHLHLDVRFLVRSAPGARAVRSAESLELGWFTPAEAARLDLDPSLARLFALVFGNAERARPTATTLATDPADAGGRR